MKDLIKMSEVYKEVCKAKGWDSKLDTKYESHLTLLQKKYRFVLQNVVFRDIKQYKGKKDNYIFSVDAPVFREILIMATKGKGQDKYCIQWLNGKIEITDFEKTSKLYDLLKSMLKKLLDDLEIDDVNYWEWIAVLDTTLHGKVATKICEIKRDIDLLFQKSKLLNHYYEMKYFKKVNDNGEVVPVFKTNGDYFIQDLKFDDMKDYIIYQIDYFEHLDSFVNVFIEWADNVSTWFAEHIVEYLSSKKVDKSTFTPTSDSIASTSFSLNFQLNKYFEEHLAFRMKLEERYNIDDLLSYFPYMDTDCEKN